MAVQEHGERFDLELVASVADGLTAQDPSGHLIYANQQAAEALGFASVDELLAAPVETVMERFEVFDQSGNAVGLADLPGRLALQGVESKATLRFRIRATGEERWALVKGIPIRDDDGPVRYAVNVFHDITEIKRAEVELQARTKQQEAIVEIGRLALGGTSLSALLDAAAETIAKTLGVDLVSILELIDEETLLLRAGAGWDPGYVGALKFHVDKNSQAGYAVLSGEPVVVGHLEREARFTPHPLITERGMTSAMSVLIETGERPFGVISVFTRSPRTFTDNDVNFHRAVANVLGETIMREWSEQVRMELLALERAARDEAEMVARRLTAMQKITDVALINLPLDDLLHELLVRIQEILRVDTAAILMPCDGGESLCIHAAIGLEEEADTSERVPIGRGVSGQIAATGQPLVIDDLSTFNVVSRVLRERKVISLAGVPLTIEARFKGVVYVGSLTSRHFMPDEIALLQILAERAASAIDRAELFEAEKEARAEAEVRQTRLSFLARASELLASSLDYRETMAAVAQLAVPHVADWCLVEMVEDGTLKAIEAVHADPAKSALTLELRRRYPVTMNEPMGPPAVIRTGKSELYEEITDAVLESAARDEEHLAILRGLGLRSAMIVPLTSRGRAVGAITFVIDRSERRYGTEDVAFAEDLARRAAAAIDNAQLFKDAQETSQRFSRLVQSVGAIFWEAEPEQFNFTFVSQQAEDLLGYPLDAWTKPGFWARIIHEEDRERTIALGDAAVGRGEDYDAEYRLVAADGRIVWVKDIVSVVTGGDDTPLLRGVMVDITDQKLVEKTLEDAKERYAHLARILQQSLLPPTLPQVPSFEVGARYRPSGAGNEVGGDFYDIFPVGSSGEYALVIGDVCGKGPRAASLTGLARHTVRAASAYERRPSMVLRVLNEAIERESDDSQFATVTYAIVRPNVGRAIVDLSSGGHPLPYLLKSNGVVRRVGTPGTLLGVLPDPELTDIEIDIEPGDTLVFYTDGVAEERGPEVEASWLPRLLPSLVGLDAETLAAAIEKAAVDYLPGEPRDDIALLVIRMVDRPPAPPPPVPST